MNRNVLWLPTAALLLAAACTQQESTAPSTPADRDNDNVSIDADVNQYPDKAPEATTTPDRDTTIHSDVDVNTPGTPSGSTTTQPQSDTRIDADVDVNTQGTTRDNTGTQDTTPDTNR